MVGWFDAVCSTTLQEGHRGDESNKVDVRSINSIFLSQNTHLYSRREVKEPRVALALRASGTLLLGLAVVYQRKCSCLLGTVRVDINYDEE